MLAIINVAVTTAFTGLYVLVSLWRGDQGSPVEVLLAYLFLAPAIYLVDRRWMMRRRTSGAEEPGRKPAPWNYWAMTLIYPFIVLTSATNLALSALGDAADPGPLYTDAALVVLAVFLMVYAGLTIERGLKPSSNTARRV